ADRSPARALPVLLWHADDLPRWATRVADGPATMGPGIANAWEEPAPPGRAQTTGADGCVTLPGEGNEIVAVSVQFADQQWFSAASPAGDDPLVLPAMVEIEIGVRGAPPDTAWEALVIPAFFMHDGDTNAAGAMRENLLTASGPGVVRLRQQQFRLGAAERVRAPMLLGHRVMINAWGHRCELRCIGHHDGAEITAPGLLEYEFVRRCATLEVCVDEPGGLPTHVSGTVFLREAADQGTSFRALAGGVARLDEGVTVGAHLQLRVILDDGEQFRSEATFAPTADVQRVAFVRGTGAPPWRVRLPGLETVSGVFAEQ